VFNDHFQFERLRANQQFDRIRDAIRERDESLHGSVNPMMADHGSHSEARQYSGRSVGTDWRCPVHFD
jgi:FPC/CPF motif-containing protein YcgG